VTVYRLLEYDIKDYPLDIKSSMLFQMNGIYQYNENKKVHIVRQNRLNIQSKYQRHRGKIWYPYHTY